MCIIWYSSTIVINNVVKYNISINCLLIYYKCLISYIFGIAKVFLVLYIWTLVRKVRRSLVQISLVLFKSVWVFSEHVVFVHRTTRREHLTCPGGQSTSHPGSTPVTLRTERSRWMNKSVFIRMVRIRFSYNRGGHLKSTALFSVPAGWRASV